MPSVTYDGRSFMIDGRRTWLVSGSIHYTRVPRELWEERIWAARLAGLNTIETPIFWNRHEPRPGQYDFEGENDIRHFIELIGKARMHCILRPGPFVGAQWDFGGLPPWLLGVKDLKLRTANQPFLEAASRYITALSEQVRDLQITSPGPGGGGPIILVQNEMHWTGGDDKEAAGYLGELARYLRESGFNVPTLNSNNLWQSVEGEIDCWTSGGAAGGGGGSGDMLATLRQLGTVKPDQPRIVIDFEVAAPAIWGVPHAQGAEPPAVLQQRLAQVLAAGGQFNLSPFHGGSNFGFWGGRLPDHTRSYVAASRDHGAPLSESGSPGRVWGAVRRLCTFASRFGKVFANLDPGYRPVIIAPFTETAQGRSERRSGSSGESASGQWPLTLVHNSGPQGSIAFIFAPPTGEAARDTGGESDAGPEVRSHSLVLADGTTIPIHIGPEGLAWCLFDAYLGGRARLDYCGLSAFGLVGKVLVVFGPAGTEGVLSINGSPLHAMVPKGRAGPAVVEHEGITVVVCNQEQIDTTFLSDDAVYLNVAGLTRDGNPIALPSARQCVRIGSDGTQKNMTPEQQSAGSLGAVSPAARSESASSKGSAAGLDISEWMMAGVTDYCDGSSARFASIDGPADLTTLGSPYGYGWYRLRMKLTSGGKSRLAAPQSADRLHLFINGDSAGLLGYGPGASSDVSVSLKRGQAGIVILAENLGRLCGGADLAEPKGIFGDLWKVDTVKAGKPSLQTADPIDVLSVRSPLFEVQPGDITHPDRITWTIQHRRKTSLIVTIGAFPGRALLVVNDTPVAYIDRGGGVRHIISQEHLRAGNNVIQLAIIPDSGDQYELDQLLASANSAGGVTFCEAATNLTTGAEWAFAKWEMPRATAFQKFKPGAARGCPVWWRARFNPPAGSTDPHHGLFFDAVGLTKGQLYINERHVGRYFVAGPDGKHVPPQQLYYIPAPWINEGEENELIIFDEHGGNPSKCRLLQDNR